MKNAAILKQIIEDRHSTYPKDYSGEEIPNHLLEEVLRAAQYAPNHKRTKPWRFRVLKGEELPALAAELQRIYQTSTPNEVFLQKKYDDFAFKISQTSAIIPIVVHFSSMVPEWEEICAVAMAVQNMYLTCTAHQLGCYWSSHPITNQLQNFLNLEENESCLGLFYMGMLKKPQ